MFGGRAAMMGWCIAGITQRMRCDATRAVEWLDKGEAGGDS